LRGEANHPLLAAAEFLGPAVTEPRFELIDLGPYPGMVADGSHPIGGELYRVDAATLADLDAFEGHPGLFRRSPIRLAGGGTAFAYLFVAGGTGRAERARRRAAVAPDDRDGVVRWRRGRRARRAPSGSG
jgi:gamma-glutamylaminecyclotransferase